MLRGSSRSGFGKLELVTKRMQNRVNDRLSVGERSSALENVSRYSNKNVECV